MPSVIPLRDRPDLIGAVFAPALQDLWPVFMARDPVANLYFDEPHLAASLDTAFAVLAPDGAVVGRAFAVAFAFGAAAGRADLPDSGWDGVIRWAHEDRARGQAPNALSALEITLLPAWRGKGVPALVLRAMADAARRRGLGHFFAPVRPTGKHREPHTPMAEYAARRTPDGLPADPWLRTHARAGGRIGKVAPASMTVAGTVAEWRAWTGMDFRHSGDWVVPGALVPVHIALDHDHGVYVEPNVWVHHRLP